VPYRWVEFKSANYIPVDVTLPVAPTAVGAPYDIYDDFSIGQRHCRRLDPRRR
jgi:hypothetical protein